MLFEILTFLFVCASLVLTYRNRTLSAQLESVVTSSDAMVNDLLAQKHQCWEHSQKCLEKVARRDAQIANQRDTIRDLHSALAEVRAERDQALEFYGTVEDLVKSEQPRPTLPS